MFMFIFCAQDAEAKHSVSCRLIAKSFDEAKKKAKEITGIEFIDYFLQSLVEEASPIPQED